MKQGTKDIPYGDKLLYDLRIKLTKAQHEFIKAHSLMDCKDMQDVVREMIEKMRDNEMRNGTDTVKIAKENRLL